MITFSEKILRFQAYHRLLQTINPTTIHSEKNNMDYAIYFQTYFEQTFTHTLSKNTSNIHKSIDCHKNDTHSRNNENNCMQSTALNLLN